MDGTNWLSFFILGIPEELFYIVTIALLVGRRDILDFKNRNKVLRIVAATILTDLCILLMRQYSDIALLNIIVQLAFFSAVYIMLLGLKWYESTLGTLIVFLTYMVLEFISVVIIILITGISLDAIKENSTYIYLATIPSRILQICLILIFYKLKRPVLNLGRIGILSSNIFKKLALIHAYLFVAFLQMLFTVKYFVLDQNVESFFIEPFFWLNIILTIVLAGILIVATNKITKNLVFEKQEKTVWLMWFRNLLSQYGYDQKSDIRKAIDEAILHTGRDNHEE